MRVEVVADVLHRERGGKTVSVSLKDRAAMFSGGQHATAAYWYDKTQHSFTTSTFYGAQTSDWFDRWRDANPIDGALVPWRAERPELYARLFGPDDGPGESDWHGLGTTFDHFPAKSSAPFDVLRATPASVELLVSLAAEAARQHQLGAGDVPDLLALSISQTDYAGHAFGTRSWEFLDVLVRADRAVGALLRALAKTRSIAVVITSDHGATPMPESVGGQRVLPADVVAKLEGALDKRLGESQWIDAYVKPFIYLSETARARRPEAIAEVIRTLEAMPEFHAVYDVREARAWKEDRDPLRRAVAMSIDPNDPDADLYAVIAPNTIVDPAIDPGKGSGHGSPWDVDREVPVLISGDGVDHRVIREVVDQRRVAPTLSALLGVSAPRVSAEFAPLTSR